MAEHNADGMGHEAEMVREHKTLFMNLGARMEALEKAHGELKLEADLRLDRAESGVNNFRAFQLDSSRKLGFVYGATWLAGIAGLIFLCVFGWALEQLVPAAKVIVDEYYREHPQTQILHKSFTPPLGEVYTVHSTPQSAEELRKTPWQANQ